MDVLGGGEDWRTNRVVLTTICSHLNVDDLLQTALVSRDWNDATKPALYKKGVVKVNRTFPLVKQLKWLEAGTYIRHDFDETGIAQFNRFVKYVDSMEEYRFEGLELSWCPLMKNHTVWAKVAPQVKALIVCKLHEMDCTSCEDSTGFLKSVLAVFKSVTSLTAGDHLPYYRRPDDLKADLYKNKKEQNRLPDPETECFEQLESLVISAAFAYVDGDFIASLIPHLKLIDVCCLSDEDEWRDFTEFLERVSSRHRGSTTNIMETGIKCDIPKQELHRLQDWFHMCAANKVKFWYAFTQNWVGPFEIEELNHAFFHSPPGELWIALDLRPAPKLDVETVIHNYLKDLTSAKVLSYRVTLASFAWSTPSQLAEDTAIWKRTFPQTGLTSLLVYSNLDLDPDQLMKVLPTASYLVISRAGQVVAEFFGTSHFLYENTAILNFITTGGHGENKHHLIHVPEFRQYVGIPDNWYPKDLNEKDKNRCVLLYFDVDSKHLDKVRKNLSRFIYPATKLKNTYQILRSFEKDRGLTQKTILNWTDPICLRLASGKSVVGNSRYKVFRA